MTTLSPTITPITGLSFEVSELIPSAVISPITGVNAKYRPLWCDTCQAVTTYTLTGDIYECDCGAFLEHIVNTAKPMYAIDLQDTPAALERFAAWAKGTTNE